MYYVTDNFPKRTLPSYIEVVTRNLNLASEFRNFIVRLSILLTKRLKTHDKFIIRLSSYPRTCQVSMKMCWNLIFATCQK